MPGKVTQFIDFSNNTANDTGENNTGSIQPIANGNPVDATNLSRPDESLRQRTEAVRSVEADSLFLRDADRQLLIAGPGKVTWPGSTTAAQSGIPVITDNLYMLPMLTPGFAQTPPVPPVASAYGVLHLKRASDSMNSISVTSIRRSYAAGDQINVQVTPGGSFTCVLDNEATYQRTIKITATGATQLSTVIAALNGLTPSAPDNTQLVTAALEGGALGTDLLLTTQAKQYVTGNYDGEGHTITPANLASFFVSNPTQALAEGDTLCVNFPMVSDTASTGGRRQAIPENTNTAVPAGAFFNSRVHPENLVNALPICKVINGALMFGTGAGVAAGSTAVDLTFLVAANIAYAGGSAWADGTTNPATNVEAQLDKIITDLAGAAGTGKIEGSAVGTYLGAATLASQISTMANFVHDDRPPAEANVVPLRTFRDYQGNARYVIDHHGYPMGQLSVLDENWDAYNPVYRIPLVDGLPVSGTWTFANGFWHQTVNGAMHFPLQGIVPPNAVITSLFMKYSRTTGTDTTSLALTTSTEGVETSAIYKQVTTGTGLSSLNLMSSPSVGYGPWVMGSSGDDTLLLLTSVITTSMDLYSFTLGCTVLPPGWTGNASTGNLAAVADLYSFESPDVDINHRSLHLQTVATAGIAGLAQISGTTETWVGADTAYVMEFICRTGVITDGANTASFLMGITGVAPGFIQQSFRLKYTGGTANWKLNTVIGGSGIDTDTGVTVAANTVYRVRLEVYGVSRNSSGNTRVVLYINGTKVAEDASRAFTDTVYQPVFSAGTQSTAAAGPYDFRVGRVRRVWNHRPAGDVL